MDHCYSKEKELQNERIPSVFGTDHSYNKICDNTCRTPTNNRKRERSTPAGKTPQQPSKIGTAVLSGQKRNTSWTEPEKDYFIQYVKHTPLNKTLTDYWEKCASAMNARFPAGMRNGLACKGLSQKLFITPLRGHTESSLDEKDIASGFCMLSTQDVMTRDVGTQTALSLPVNTNTSNSFDVKDGEWLFMEPRKELEPVASVGAEYLHRTALKRLRHYLGISDGEKASLIDVLCSGTPRQFARALMSSSLAEEIKALLIFDIEMDVRECCSKSSILSNKQYEDLKEFKWSDILNELVTRQSTLAEVLLAVALPTGKIGCRNPIETLCPVVATVYGMLMKQRSGQPCK
ncbi:uncharacterized protein LOC123554926 isoform X2 [Mercenaria mercenaria]|uniref:uncharacterized protein LOC123554926 isoform X2 n=1 Tax=Mercenaria mercenaria TaxID=6596 RepID=UPI00234F0B3C|nr:uncharacterized protein LOC123554926 isoform X2 [Mercenaria mercenaria]